MQLKVAKLMGQLAFLKTFILVKGSRHLRSVAKIWIEKNGEKCIEIAESELTAKENNMIVAAIDRHWEFLNDQISKTFRGEKPQPKNIEK